MHIKTQTTFSPLKDYPISWFTTRSFTVLWHHSFLL